MGAVEMSGTAKVVTIFTKPFRALEHIIVGVEGDSRFPWRAGGVLYLASFGLQLVSSGRIFGTTGPYMHLVLKMRLEIFSHLEDLVRCTALSKLTYSIEVQVCFTCFLFLFSFSVEF